MDTFENNLHFAEHVANKIAGKSGPITLRIRKPIYSGCSGMTMKTKAGRYFIDIHPDYESLKQLRTFFHEVAHVYMKHFDGITGVNGLDLLEPGTFKVSLAESKTPTEADERQEKEADLLGGVWYTYAENNYNHYGENLIKHRLMAFLEWAYL